jgi:beta-glucosidase
VLTLEFAGQATLHADDERVVAGFREASPMVTGPEYPLHAVLDLAADQVVELRVEYATSVAISIPGIPVQPHLRLGIAEPDDHPAHAAALAAECDAAVVLAGRVSGEAMDVESVRLPGRQEAVIAAVATANPRTVAVTLSAGPVVLPQVDDLGAWVHAWFPGEQFAPALADVLTGRAECGGRLPITFPVDEDNTPIQRAEQYPGVDGVAVYSEELLVGYRWYDESEVRPAYPFGHGLGYTTFDLDDLTIESAGESFNLRFRVRNTGRRPGKAVPQIYVAYPSDAGEPPAQLKGFATARLDPGEARDLTIAITRDDLMVHDEHTHGRVLPRGDYEFRLGLSSRDIRATARLALV